MTCRELIAVLDDYLDGALPEDVKRRLRRLLLDTPRGT